VVLSVRASISTFVVATAVAILAMPRTIDGQGRGASVRGRVELPRMMSLAERRPAAADLGEAPARSAIEPRRAVVYFETAPKGAFEDREGGHVSMDQRNETFVPHLLAITVGTTVDFPNNDRTYHNVFSLSKARRFDLGRYATGRSKAIRFDRPGIVRVFCEIHSHMNAFILVFSHRFFAVSDADGRYQIDAVPPGTYTLVAWIEGVIRDAKSITITPDTRSVETDFPAR
jgi:plastocyanin